MSSGFGVQTGPLDGDSFKDASSHQRIMLSQNDYGAISGSMNYDQYHHKQLQIPLDSSLEKSPGTDIIAGHQNDYWLNNRSHPPLLSPPTDHHFHPQNIETTGSWNPLLNTSGPNVPNAQTTNVPKSKPALTTCGSDEDFESEHGFDVDEVLEALWAKWVSDIQAKQTAADFKQTYLPLARVKRVMKLDPDTPKLGIDAVAVLTEAATTLVEHITILSLVETNIARRRVLRREDFCSALPKDPMFDFLVDFVDRAEEEPERLAGIKEQE